METEEFDLVGAIIDFENGELDDAATLVFFGYLIRSGLAWSLQGMYGRLAMSLIEDGWFDEKGNQLKQLGQEAA